MRRPGGAGVPLKAIKWMFQRHAPLAIGLDGTSFQDVADAAQLRHPPLYGEQRPYGAPAEYSRDCLKRCATPPAFSMKGAEADAAAVPYRQTV